MWFLHEWTCLKCQISVFFLQLQCIMYIGISLNEDWFYKIKLAVVVVY